MNVNDKYYKELLEQYADIQLKLTMYEQAMEELDDIDVNDISREVSSYADEMYPRILKLLRHKMLPRSIKGFAKKYIPKAARVAAVFVLIIYVGLTVAIASSETVRKYVGSFLIERTDEYSSIAFVSSDISVEVPEGWMSDYFFTYIPDGFVVDSVLGNTNMNIISFTDENFDVLMLSIGDVNAASNYDTEDFYVETIVFRDGTAEYAVHNNGDKYLTWIVGDKYFVLYTTLPYEQLIQVAESIMLVR